MRSAVIVLAVVLAVAAASTSAFGKTIKVPGDFDNIQEASDEAQSGDTILVKKGVWKGELTIRDATDIRLKGKGKPVLDGDGAKEVLVIANSDKISVSGFVIENAIYQAVAIRECTEVLVTKCVIRNSVRHGLAVGQSDGIEIGKNTFDNCASDAVNLDLDLTGTPSKNCLVQKNRISGCGENGIHVTGSGHDIIGNRLEGCGSDGIVIDDSTPSIHVLVSKNRVTGCGWIGIVAYGEGHLIEKNRITDASDDGIRIMGDDCDVIKNRTAGSGDDGIDVEGADNRIEKNRISRPDGDGFDADGDNNEYVGNKVTSAGDDGIDVDGGNNLVEKNSFMKCGDHGIVVDSDGNHFIRNKALKNDDDDIWTDVAPTDNHWEGNKFKTGNAPD